MDRRHARGPCVGAIEVFFNGGNDLPRRCFYIFTLVFVWVSVLAAILSFRVGKWLPTAGAFARFLLLGFFTLSVLIYGIKHGVHGLGAGATSRPIRGFVVLVGVLLFNYVGFELPSSAGEEMTNPQRDVPFAISRSAVASVLLYGIPVLGILLVLPTVGHHQLRRLHRAPSRTSSPSTAATSPAPARRSPGPALVLGDFFALLFILCLLTSGVTWIMGSDRALAVSGYDGAAPRFLGVISARFGTPVRVNIFSGILASIVVVLAHRSPVATRPKYFAAVLGVTISTTLICYIGSTRRLWRLRRSHPDVHRPYRMPFVGR